VTPDVHALTGAYALDALDDIERRRFEAHLAGCADCASEVAGLRETAARLGAAMSEPPPDRLRQQVLHRITTTTQVAPPRRATRSGTRRVWTLRLVAAAAAVALAAAVGLGVYAWQTAHQLATAQEQLAQTQARYGAIGAILAETDAQASSVTGPEGISAFVMASREANRAVLVVSNLPPLDSGRTYQAWLIGAGDPRSAGLFQAGTTEAIPSLAFGALDGARTIAVTVEPAGGSTRPTTSPLLSFPLPT
jgi:anti-sigma-K factor RskA